ncbi:efflux RND transporter periplasmic adaptor subunit [Pedobacter sp. HMWF019]|uniref:efflux RND transporter periplasmic adaptor subunit n=1 Tax=Pedobacter sp. HMWF019 TaxID=2056856 RepID=UPI000D3907BA|nr:efflux RND transporter periplasmic adaptor subunit [Pedobacter sp. HMWF019]PTT00749.1 efflux RND transporter periplasmic adaptor subunit [Pedobacter sp. HMWF019]
MKPINLPLISLAVTLLIACGPQQPSEGQGQPAEFPVMQVETQDAVINNDYPATIQGQQNIEIRPKVDGFVEKIFVDEGAVVKKGQPLFRINAPQYEQEIRTASAAIKNAEAELNTAKMQVEKTIPLVKEGIISNYELKQASFNQHAKEAALAQAKASLANARTNVGYTMISSPADGVVGNIPYKTGSLVSSSSAQPLTTVSNISRVYVYFSFNEKKFLDFVDQYTGKTMEDKLRQFPPVLLLMANGKVYPEKGRMETLSGLISTETGSVNLRASFLNPVSLLRSGASATIRIPVVLKQALLIPSKATYEMQEKTMVFTVDPKGKVKSTEIEILDVPSGEFYVVKKGLQVGDKLVTEGAGALKDGMEIKPVSPKIKRLVSSKI